MVDREDGSIACRMSLEEFLSKGRKGAGSENKNRKDP
jgi:hypothetical protein